MLQVLRSLWIWFATAFIVLLWVPVLCVVVLFDRNPLRVRTARMFRRLGPAVANVNPAWRVRISGREHLSPGRVYVVVANHQSLADIPLIAHLGIDAKWLAKAELLKFPVFGWMMRISRDIGVERGDRRKAAQSLLQCAKTLRNRLSIITFPEGTRSKTGEILPFNDGPFLLAAREGVPVLPVVVEGTGTALPRETWMFGPTQDIILHVMPPIEPSSAADGSQLRDQVRSVMIARLQDLRASR
jgi:1-acyl-sn-glycerol-3-phosphate acyltransferase